MWKTRSGHAGKVSEAGVGSRYRFRLDDQPGDVPDPVSRFQPEGPHGPSEVVDPEGFAWTDRAWPGVRIQGQVLYELHVGTFTPEGTWAAALGHLPRLADLGVTVLEIMPVAEFPGLRGWGYDGVDLFAPSHLYGRPDDFKSFVNRAHELGLGVILDVVYNHVGPDGNFLKRFSERYFSKKHMTDWGEGINYESDDVREFFLSNAEYWISEFHLDGLRLDSTQDIHDDSAEHILATLSRRARAAAGSKPIILVAENEPQNVRLVTPLEQGGYGLDALWNDDFHHTARVLLTGSRDGYYADYSGSPQQIISTFKYGCLFQGQFSRCQKKRRGTTAFDIKPASFVVYLENHDQVANSARGLRLGSLASPACLRAMTALLLLAPGTPMLFQGQEWGSENPFHYFTDHRPELAESILMGRRAFLNQFESMKDARAKACVPDPSDTKTVERCRLDPSRMKGHVEALHRDLLRIRGAHAAFRAQRPHGVDGAVLGARSFVLRFFEPAGEDRLMLVNFGETLSLESVPEPLLGPPAGRDWVLIWSSEDPDYGGAGTPSVEPAGRLRIPGQSSLVFGLA